MNWMQFIVELVDKAIWPAIVIVFLFILRMPLLTLLNQTRKFKFKDFEIEFGQKLKGIAKKAEGAFPELKQDKKCSLIIAAEKLPNSTVLEAWKAVDESAEKLVHSRDKDVDLNIENRYKFMEKFLLDEKIIDTKKGKLFSELRQLRNKVAYAPGYSVGKAEVVLYVELCFRLVDYFESLIGDSRTKVVKKN